MSEFSVGGYIKTDTAAQMKVVPYRGPDVEGTPDRLLDRDGKTKAHIIWYDVLTMAYIPTEAPDAR